MKIQSFINFIAGIIALTVIVASIISACAPPNYSPNLLTPMPQNYTEVENYNEREESYPIVILKDNSTLFCNSIDESTKVAKNCTTSTGSKFLEIHLSPNDTWAIR